MLGRVRVTGIACLLLLLGGSNIAEQAAPNAEPAADRVSGRVLAPDGEPVTGAEVWIRVAEQSPWNKHTHDDWFDPIAVTTDEQGRFVAELDAEGPYRLLARHPEHPIQPHDDDISSGASVEIAFVEPLEQAVYVVDENGKPVPGADVIACRARARANEFGAPACRNARTGDDGRHVFTRLGRGTQVFQAVAPGKAWSEKKPSKLPLRSAAQGETKAIPLPLRPGAEVSGSVRDDAGLPLGGVYVYYASERVRLGQSRQAKDVASFVPVLSDDEGAFTFRGLPAGEPLKLFAQADSRRTGESPALTLAPGAALTGVTVVYDRPASAVVRVVDADEQPIGAIEVLWKPVKEKRQAAGGLMRMRGFAALGKVEPLDEGRFRLYDVKPGLYDITLVPEGYEEIVLEAVRLKPGAERDLGTRFAREGIALSGYVIDDLGAPVVEAKIEGSYLKDGAAMARSVKSGEDGGFHLGGLSEGPLLRLKVEAEGFARKIEQNVPIDRSGYEVVLERAGSVTGLVLLADGSKPRGLRARIEEGRRRGGVFSFNLGDDDAAPGDEEGRFEIEDAAPGTYSLELKASGTRTLRVKDVVVTPGEVTDVGTHELEPGRRLAGTVLDLNDDSPISGAGVRVDAAGAMFGGNSALGSARTDGEGRFEVGGLEEGSLIVAVEHLDHAPAKERITLAEDEPAEELIIRLGRGGLLRGTVRDDGGQPSPNRMIAIGQGGLGSPGDDMVRTDDEGRYRVERLQPGAYVVRLFPDPTAGVLDIRQQNAAIREGEETVVDFDGGAKITFEGRLTRGGRPVGEVTVMLVPGGPAGMNMLQMKSATVDLDGRFELGLNAPGDYNVIVQDLNRGLGAILGQARIVVPDEPNVSLEIPLQAGSISGRVTDRDGNYIRDSGVGATIEGATPGELGTSTGARVEADGSYRMEGVADGTYTVSAVAEGYQLVTQRVAVQGSGEVGNIDFVLERAGQLRGRVADSGGNGISGAYVFATPSGAPGQSGVPAQTDAEGFFEVSAPTDGPCDLEAVAGGFAPAEVTGYLPSDDPQDPGALITLVPGGRIVVLVLNSEGYPEAGVQPLVQPDTPSDGLRLALMFNPPPATDGDGRSVAPNLPDGSYTVSLPGRPEIPARAVSLSGSGEVVVTLQAP